MSRRACFRITEISPHHILLEDVGPWDRYLTITNDAENVIRDLSPILAPGQRVLYRDSEGILTELKHKDGVFTGFGG
jgi:hypothetical protein